MGLPFFIMVENLISKGSTQIIFSKTKDAELSFTILDTDESCPLSVNVIFSKEEFKNLSYALMKIWMEVDNG